MKTHNAQNERVKHTYFTYLREAKGMSEPSIDQTAKALSRFEAYTGHRDFKQFHRKQAEAFKQHLAGQRGQRTNEPLSKATIYSTLTTLKAFFVWLAGQYRRKLKNWSRPLYYVIKFGLIAGAAAAIVFL